MRHVRTLFVSDAHLGFVGSRARELERFLGSVRCDKLFLVGDILDMWRLRNRWHWPDSHDSVLRRILDLAQGDTEVVFVPGNHDEAARQYVGLEVGGVQVKSFDYHTTRDGRRLWITHGDQYDLVMKHSKLLSWLGGMAYDTLVWINHVYNGMRAALGHPYWSLAKHIKSRVRSAHSYIERFEEALVTEAAQRDCQGVVCGHVHRADAKNRNGIDYFNCGDWVESCTALVEHLDGTMEGIDGLAWLAEADAIREEVLEPRAA